jgi:hypothetical protein
MVNYVFFNPSRLGDNVEKCCSARQATNDNIIRHMPTVYWVTKPTDTHTHTHTHSECVILTAFPLQQGCTNAPQYYLICSLPALLKLNH